MKFSCLEGKLCQFFVRLAKGHAEVELQRRILCDNEGFTPRLAFHCLNSLKLDSLLPELIHSYLCERGVDCTQQDLYLVARQYSSEGNGRLSYDDFYDLVVCRDRSEVLAARYNWAADLPKAAHFVLGTLLNKEIKLQVSLENAKNDIASVEGFSVFRAFKALDLGDKGKISKEDFKGLAQKTGGFLLDSDVENIFRRIDLKRDGEIDYYEFMEALRPMQRVRTPEPATVAAIKDAQGMPLGTLEEESNEEIVSEEFDREIDFELSEGIDDLSETEEQNTFETPKKAEPKPQDLGRSCRVLKHQYTGKHGKGLETLIQQLHIERKLEFAREELALNLSFSVPQTMEFFARTQKSRFFISDLEKSLAELNIECSPDCIYLIFSRYAVKESVYLKIDLKQLSYMLLSNAQEYSDKVKHREPEPMNELVILALRGFMELLIYSESELEKLRISSRAEDQFEVIDRNLDDLISSQDLEAFLVSSGVDPAQKDLQLIFSLYEANIGEGITLTQFKNQLTPRLEE